MNRPVTPTKSGMRNPKSEIRFLPFSRFSPCPPCLRGESPARPGYTLVEVLVATVLALVMMAAVVQIFALIGNAVSSSRSNLEMSDRLRATETRLKLDLEGVTATMLPPRHPESDEGYFEYMEGPVGPMGPAWAFSLGPVAWNINAEGGPTPDDTVGDFDDILMMTTRNTAHPFVGRLNNVAVKSEVAEVAWFLRGNVLYRRVLLVVPNASSLSGPYGFFEQNDISVRQEGGNLLANTLGDLTKRENRFAHQSPDGFPWDPHDWEYDRSTNPPTISPWAGLFQQSGSLPWPRIGPPLGLPTLRECSYVDRDGVTPDLSWVAGATLPRFRLNLYPSGDNRDKYDAWANPYPYQELDATTGTLRLPGPPNPPNDPRFLGRRIAEDVILTNVIGFDVKAWDPGAPVITNGTLVLAPDAPNYVNPLLPDALAERNGWRVLKYGAYVDLGYNSSYLLDTTTNPPSYMTPPAGVPAPLFHRANYDVASPGPRSGLGQVYDTWSFHYEHDGVNQFGRIPTDAGTNGFDDSVGIDANGDGDFNDPGDVAPQLPNGIVDDPSEMEAQAPYPVPLRGIQVRIRVFEPDSRQIREVTVVQDFLPK